MQTSKCSNCGADIDYAAKFCRRCGQAIDPSEWTTRKLEEPSQFEQPPRFESPTRPANSWSTSPTYLPPDAMPPQAAVTSGIQPTGQKRTIMTLAGVIAILLVVLAALVFFTITKNSDGPASFAPPPPPGGPVASTPPPIPSTPSIPSVPQVPPVSPVPNSDITISKDLIYPGAEVTMEVKGQEKAKVAQLSTPDSFDKVVEWYVKKIKPNKQVTIPGGNAVLKGEGIAVMIMNGGNVTSILITQGEN